MKLEEKTNVRAKDVCSSWPQEVARVLEALFQEAEMKGVCLQVSVCTQAWVYQNE